MALADIAVDVSEASVLRYSSDVLPTIAERFAELENKGLEQLLAQGVEENTVSYERYLNLRYTGSDTKLMLPEPKNGDWAEAFIETHLREFAFILQAPIEVDGIRVRAISKADVSFDESASTWVDEMSSYTSSPDPTSFGHNETYFEEFGTYTKTPLYRLQDLTPGALVSGPAIVLDATQTILLHPQNTAHILKDHVM